MAEANTLLSGLTKAEHTALNKGELLPVMEHFHTIQGEGAHSGLSSYFIRIGGCDVGCVWCDVKESWDATKHPLTEIADLTKIASEKAKTIIITGGEPLIYNMDFITSSLKKQGARVHIETSGAYPLSGNWDWICLSPKKFLAPKPEIYSKANELKVIVFNKSDFKFAEEEAKKVSAHCELFLQPEWDKREQMTPLILDYVLNNPQWKISLQTHKYLGIP